MDKTQLPLEHDDFFETSHRFSSMHTTMDRNFSYVVRMYVNLTRVLPTEMDGLIVQIMATMFHYF